ncbi:hypothetical protein [Mycobacterium marinum]|uniref:hypothetical protein n=1 Tax=Mycobacterium marinum TaxID=1781 RepID=UPI000B963981|nr:hypothetical protein [Mycobacterium marinum]
MRIVRRGHDVFGQSTPSDQWYHVRVAENRDYERLQEDLPVDIDLCICGHLVGDHTQENMACDRLVVENQKHGGQQWHVCRCKQFDAVSG